MTPSTHELLQYSELQVAAEAFDPSSISGLMQGNGHSSRFTDIEAVAFLQKYSVVAVSPASFGKSGFSGTLFQNKQTGALVLSFRSTEFLDDAVRDNQSTNTFEVKQRGWAFGQIADMENWYQNLIAEGKLAADASLTVTGYSLGGALGCVLF